MDVIKWLAVLFLGVTTILLQTKLKYGKTQQTKVFKPDIRIRNVDIFYQPNEQMFPQHWFVSPINASVNTLEESEKTRTTSILQKALRKYPLKMNLHLRDIYVFKSLRFYGIPFGGTYIAPVWNRLYIANDSFSEEFVERVFHAELSSVFYKTYPEYLDWKLWLSVLPEHFVYSNSENPEFAILQLGELSELSETMMLEQGFLASYATTNLENDFNSIVKQLFYPSEQFWTWVETYPRIKVKTALVIDFYNRLYFEFNESYFKTFAAKASRE